MSVKTIFEKEEKSKKEREMVSVQQRYIFIGNRIFEVYEDKQGEKISVCL